MALVLLFLLVTSFTVFAEELDTLPPTYPPPPPHHAPSPLHPPTYSPHHPPASPPFNPPVHYPPPPPHAPAKPPTHHHTPPPTHHHYPPTPPFNPPVHFHPPFNPPVHSPPPPHAPAKPPTHHHAPPPTYHHYPPTPPAPAKPPTHSHYPPPPHRPVVHPLPRSLVAVQGVVYVKSCKYAGVDTLLGATPLLGAVVKFECNNAKYKLVQTAKTDKNGYFFLEAPKTISTYGVHKCRVVLVSAPNGLKPSNLNGGVTGSNLRIVRPYMSQKLPFLLYSVGPLAFEPKCPR